MNAAARCPACNHAPLDLFHEARGVPSNSCILLPTRAEARAYPRGDIALGFCAACGFVTNTAFDPRLTEYSGRYEETQGFSPTFGEFHRGLADRLIAGHGLRDRDVLEIGCGKGEFLLLLCQRGGNRGLGFDPAFVPARIPGDLQGRVRFVQDFYSERYAGEQADFVCCKMTLEHIQPVRAFLDTVRRAVGDRPATVVFFMVPDAERIVRECAFEDIYYEHCSYFHGGSLRRLFARCGFETLAVGLEYEGQYLTIEARPARGGAAAQQTEDHELQRWRAEVAAFPAAFAARRRQWRERLDAWRGAGRRVALWGSGSKGVAFLSTLGAEDEIACAVDINPYRQGCFMPGSGVEIVAPERLRQLAPDVVVIMNAVYRREIGERLRELDLAPELLAL